MVSYRGALANYRIRHSDEQEIEANLIRYMGEKKDTPRQFIYFEQQGRCSFESIEEKELLEAVYQAASQPTLAY